MFDHDEAGRALSGLIAFQIHKGPAMKIEIRNIGLKCLPKADLISPDETPVPADAADVNPPKAPKGRVVRQRPKSRGDLRICLAIKVGSVSSATG